MCVESAAPDMGRQHYLRDGFERIGHRRFILIHIETGAPQFTRLQQLDQDAFVNDRSAGDIYHDPLRSQRAQHFPANRVPVTGIGAGGDYQDIGPIS